MKRWIPLLITLAGCGPAIAPPSLPAPPKPLAAVVDSVVSSAPLDRTHWGVLVVDAASGRELYRHDAARHYIPASNTKLVVTAVALGLLGPDYRYTTTVRAGALRADTAAVVVVRGSGDPTLSARFFGARHAALDSLAHAIRRQGVHAIDTLIVDAGRFVDEHIHGAWEVGDLPWSYAPPTAAFAVEEGTFPLVVAPGSYVGAPASAHVPGTAAQPVVARVTTDTTGARTRLRIDYLERIDTVYVTGTIGLGAPPDTSSLAVTRPAHFAATAFGEALGRAGVAVGAVVVATDSAESRMLEARTTPVVEHASPPMSDIVAAILRPSQNWIAEQVLKTLGAEHGEGGGWAEGLAVERRYLIEEAGVDSMSFSLSDASGLSAQNLLAPEAIVRLLAHARARPWADAYRSGMAQPGLEGSTLARRFPGLEGRLFAKTGTIANVNSLSGYVVADDGRELLFSILTNGSGRPSANVRAGIDRIVQAIAAGGGS